MTAKQPYLLAVAIFLITFSIFGQNNFFTKIENNDVVQKTKTTINKTETIAFEFNYEALSDVLSKTSNKSSSLKTQNVIISFPDIDGKTETYSIEEASVFHADLQAKYPEIKSYVGYGIDSPTAYLRFSLSPYKGLSGVILGKEKTLFFKPNSKKINQVTLLTKSNEDINASFNCLTESNALNNTLKNSLSLKDADDSQKRTYRLALSVTGEYSNFHGGTLPSVNAAIAATLTNINAVFEKDFNMSLELIGANDSVIYLNSTTDPYTNISNYNSELANTLDTVILEANYDIGHLIGGVNDSNNNPTGDAGCIGCVCNNGGVPTNNNHKGSGFSTGTSPSGFHFDINYVIHEMGHQFGANHTWTHGGNEGSNVQVEPGSGSTIMGYAGITGSTNVQPNSDPYFHSISIEQVTTFIKSTSCATITNTGNTTPTVNAGSDLTLPIGTPFKLVGSGSDSDGDVITYCWEQFDENNALTTYPDPNSINPNSVLFRSYPPTTNNIRYFPNLSDLKFGVNATQWEKIPNTNRIADFRLTVRDNKVGGANNTHDDMRVTFNTAYGPFEVTSQNTPGLLWASGTNETITWNVNNTNSLPGASNVNILLSTDGGATYNTIVNNIPNSGSYLLNVPNTPAPYCRLMIEPTNANFFAINSEDFAIDYTINTTCTQYNSAPNLGINITDNGGAFTQNHVINIPAAATISDINIGVNITHPYIGDLGIAVLSADGTEILVKSSQDCSDENNIISVFNDDSIQFNCFNSDSNIASKSLRDLLSNLNGENTFGNWTIRLGDFASGDIGTLNSWFVEVCETIETPLSTDEFDLVDYKIFPNPNNGEFNIQFKTSKSKKIKIEVYDLSGRSIYKNSYEISDGAFNENIILNNAQTGLYILNLDNGINKTTKKIIVQ
jgi:subtilisin-like proprotein convertase family protein